MCLQNTNKQHSLLSHSNGVCHVLSVMSGEALKLECLMAECTSVCVVIDIILMLHQYDQSHIKIHIIEVLIALLSSIHGVVLKGGKCSIQTWRTGASCCVHDDCLCPSPPSCRSVFTVFGDR